MRKPSMGGRQHWVMLDDETTKYKMSFFFKRKNEPAEHIIDWIRAFNARHNIELKIIRCDNAGENKVLERESDKKELGIIFEFTAPGTPRQNGVVVRVFVTFMRRTRAMMNHAGLQWLRDSNCGVRQHRLPQCWITFWCKKMPKETPFTQFV